MTKKKPPSALPEILPIFPISGVLLLPRGRLPLNIFEDFSIAMIDEALGLGRIIGMIQPTEEEDDDDKRPALYQVGCAGHITSFSETEDGRYLVNLSGACRFRVKKEAEPRRGYRRAHVDWEPFLTDLLPPDKEAFDRARLMEALRPYFKMNDIAADWSAIQNAGGEAIVAALSMICPFAPNEKQGLLEAPTLTARAELLTALLEMAVLASPDDELARH
jgi:uncharacterized protein